MGQKNAAEKTVCENRKARHDYFIHETYEAGIELFGTEVKSLRAGRANLKDAYGAVKKGELFIEGMHISPYERGNLFNRDPLRTRKLLMHRQEIRKLAGKISERGYTLVPLQVYFKDQHIKVEVGLAKGKKLYDKREAIARKDRRREAEREFKVKNM